MRTDLDYLKGMMTVFLDSEQPFISTGILDQAGFDISSDKGMFHYMQLIEQGFISNRSMVTHNPEKLGYIYHLGGMSAMDVEIRLTTSGQDFATALESKDVFERLKEISNEPLSVIKDVGVELLKSYAKKRFGLSD
ncbi:DUF2513 domain-containing protein [Pantoea ananatis]|uniref:DUF2513 domain-containing protein n=1 Tax=Pantoea ananas TaxID=553 RepID=UPI0006396E3F|nr:DUF2513 domain-containing protein [Pantoea ananatis]KKW51379.1 hypothetical protein XB02_06495 [Pantoea ananatis]REF09749.1 uncharacterized protein DUF2513 [Pantoea ananatis]UYL01311.1 DUF2513 domain-containing protein [Pantoea ananatis]